MYMYNSGCVESGCTYVRVLGGESPLRRWSTPNILRILDLSSRYFHDKCHFNASPNPIPHYSYPVYPSFPLTMQLWGTGLPTDGSVTWISDSPTQCRQGRKIWYQGKATSYGTQVYPTITIVYLPPSVCAIWFEGSNDHCLLKRSILFEVYFCTVRTVQIRGRGGGEWVQWSVVYTATVETIEWSVKFIWILSIIALHTWWSSWIRILMNAVLYSIVS